VRCVLSCCVSVGASVTLRPHNDVTEGVNTHDRPQYTSIDRIGEPRCDDRPVVPLDLALIPLLTEKDDKDVQWHAKHGIVLMVAEIGFWIVFTILTNIIIAATLGLGCLVSLLVR